MPYLIQILLPLYDNKNQLLPAELHAGVKEVLTEKFGGLTAHTRAPAEGEWKEGAKEVRDDIVIYEVISPSLGKRWWKEYRQLLELRFKQEEVMIRALEMVRL